MRQDSSLAELGAASWRLFLMWTRGWWVIGKTILAYLIAALLLAPVGLVLSFAAKSPPGSWTLLFCIAGILFYVPLVFYVAASWVGFCPYVGAPEDELSSYRNPEPEIDRRGA